MRKQIWNVAAGAAAVAALIAVPAAMAAYTSPKLEVFSAATGVTVRASLSPNDDPTARVTITAPTGTQLTTTQAPGTVLGQVEALVKALDLGGADLPLQGQLVVAAPGQVAPVTQAACLGTTPPIATWAMVLTAAGQTLTVPTYLVATTGAATALGPATIAICLPPPDVPAGTPGRAAFGAKVYSAALTINGVFGRASGTWVSTWVPYNPGFGTVNQTGAVVAPAHNAPGAITVAARRVLKAGAIVSGAVTQGGQPRAGATVTIFGGPRASGLKRLGRVRTAASGRFTFRAKTGTFFRASAVSAAGTSPAVCAQLAPALGSVPCVNPTANGFAAQSRVVRKR